MFDMGELILLDEIVHTEAIAFPLFLEKMISTQIAFGMTCLVSSIQEGAAALDLRAFQKKHCNDVLLDFQYPLASQSINVHFHSFKLISELHGPWQEVVEFALDLEAMLVIDGCLADSKVIIPFARNAQEGD